MIHLNHAYITNNVYVLQDFRKARWVEYPLWSKIVVFIWQQKPQVQRHVSICLPGSEIADWFSKQGFGSSRTIQLPPHCWNRNLIKFALCVVIELEEGFDANVDEFFVHCFCHFEIRDTPSETKHDQFCVMKAVNVHWLGSYHIWISSLLECWVHLSPTLLL